MMDNYNNITNQFFELIKPKLSAVAFDTWFKPLKINKIDENINIVYLNVDKNNSQHDFIKKVIKMRYIPIIENTFKEILKKDYRVVIKEKSDTIDNDINQNDNRNVNYNKIEKIFDPRFNFDNFVVGECNKYAHAAALAVAESPSETFNPLFLYGDSGLGKTHLMHAIGTYLLEHNPELNVLYVSSEMFTNEFIKSLNCKTPDEFKNKYRSVDVLLIDDVQFFENKKGVQDEFFYTFNSLYELNKQIVISSDESPNKLNLSERLRTRFAWNLVADIQPADYETRVAIMMKWAENENLEVTDEIYEVFCMISEKIKTNIRELEGAFKRIISFSNLLNEEINLAFAKRILNDIMITKDDNITPEKIKNVVCKHFNIKISDLDSNKRTSEIAFARQVAMYLCRNMTDYSLSQTGKLFGNKHYTTVIHACDKIQKELNSNSSIKELIEDLKSKISK